MPWHSAKERWQKNYFYLDFQKGDGPPFGHRNLMRGTPELLAKRERLMNVLHVVKRGGEEDKHRFLIEKSRGVPFSTFRL